MGMDISLEWDGMTEEDKAAQKKYGRGALRASIGMINENGILYEFFGESMFNAHGGTFDFATCTGKLNEMCWKYLERNRSGTEPDNLPQRHYDSLAKSQAALQQQYPGKNVVIPKINRGDCIGSVGWANELIQFCKLGMYMQKAGKNPRISISY
ncbi:MAG: hypothetical protein NT051_00995 [Candidatus Micrarchaeota archaeon]|nr:hypothetical protein [Candidatus Micrarchaeota archaeon]